MGGRWRWLGVLSVIALGALAACEPLHEQQPPEWTPWNRVDGKFRPEVEQVPAATIADRRLRVVSFNTLWGVDLGRDAAFFTSDPDLAGADVIALQEVNRGPGEARSDAGQLAGLLHMGYVFVPTFDWDGALYGVALLSRFPLHDIEVMLLPEPQLDIVEPAARAALRARIDTDAGPVMVTNVHLDVALSIPERVLQLRPAVLDSPAPAVVLGDFNTNDYVWALDSIPLLPLDAVASTSQAPALDDYMRAIGYDTPTAELGHTWHGIPEDQRLDSIFTRGLETGDGAVERELDTSDHWPIWLDVTVGPADYRVAK